MCFPTRLQSVLLYSLLNDCPVIAVYCNVLYCIVMYCTVCSYFSYCCEGDALHGSLFACIHILVPIHVQLLN